MCTRGRVGEVLVAQTVMNGIIVRYNQLHGRAEHHHVIQRPGVSDWCVLDC